jgi:sulfatase modifying factor 1
MAFLSGGTYTMEERGNTATVQAFCLDKTEVTSGAYTQCVQSKMCEERGLRCGLRATYGHPEKADHPINCVDWKQAVTYCQSLGKRLPTEEEWEWAARGQEGAREYPWGDGDPRSIVCWSGATDRRGTCKVGAFVASDTAAGIHDLAGNVWEWTSSSYSSKGTAKVNRGGGWISNRAADLRASNRYSDEPTNRTDYDGFRCAR